MGFVVVGALSGSSELSSNTDQNCGAGVRVLPRQNGRSPIPIKEAECKLALRQTSRTDRLRPPSCEYLRGQEAEGEQEQNFANQSALALYA